MLLRSKNIEIINLINNININSIIDNNTNIYIDLIEYQSLKTNNKYLILLTHISIEIYMIYDLNLVHTKSYKFSNLFNRKFFTYNDKLFIISNNGINVFNLQDIDQNIIYKSHNNLYIENLGYINNLKYKQYSYDNNKLVGFFNVLNSTNIYLYRLIDNNDFFEYIYHFNLNFKAIDYLIVNLNSRNLFIIIKQNGCEIYNIDKLLNFTKINGKIDNLNINKSNTFIHIEENIFIKSYKSKLDVYNLDINNENIYKFNYIRTIIINTNEIDAEIEYYNNKLYYLSKSDGFYIFKLDVHSNNIYLTNMNYLDSFTYYVDESDVGTKKFIKSNNIYYLLDTHNGLITFKENYNFIHNLNKNKIKNSKPTIIYPSKIFLHINYNNQIKLDFESKIDYINKRLNMAIIRIPRYVSQQIFVNELLNKTDKTFNNYILGFEKYNSLIKDYIKIQIYNSNNEYSLNNYLFKCEEKLGFKTNISNYLGCYIINDKLELTAFINNNYRSVNNKIINKLFKSVYNDKFNNSIYFYLNNYKNVNINDRKYFIINDPEKYKTIELNIIYEIYHKDKFIGLTKFIRKNELLMEKVFKNELDMLNNSNNIINLKNNKYKLIKYNINIVNNKFLLNNSIKIIKSYSLGIDIINIFNLNNLDLLNLSKKIHLHKLDYYKIFKNNNNIGFLVVNISDNFQIFNKKKLLIGDIIISINNSIELLNEIIDKKNVDIKFYRFNKTLLKWEKYCNSLRTIELMNSNKFLL